MFSLKKFNSFGVECRTPYIKEVFSFFELKNLILKKNFREFFVLGGGTNILFLNKITGPVIKNSIGGIKIVNENDNAIYVSVGAGVNWHHLVLWCISKNYGGIENLSLIPGLVGASPIQNIGAYGTEICDVFHELECIEIKNGSKVNFNASDCKFSYRDSIFKNEYKGEFIITNVTLRLTKKNHKINTNYGEINETLQQMKILSPSIKDVSDAIVKIRSKKLPNHKEIGNAGSFFKNPIINLKVIEKLIKNYPDIPVFPLNGEKVKISAAWLIEKCGFKGKRIKNVGMHRNQSLVLVNYGDATGTELWNYAKEVKKKVFNKFKIKLEEEVNLIN